MFAVRVDRAGFVNHELLIVIGLASMLISIALPMGRGLFGLHRWGLALFVAGVLLLAFLILVVIRIWFDDRDRSDA